MSIVVGHEGLRKADSQLWAWKRLTLKSDPQACKFAAAVVARHAEEYPHPRDPARTDRELRELALDNILLMNLARQVVGLEPRDDLLPTEDYMAGFVGDE